MRLSVLAAAWQLLARGLGVTSPSSVRPERSGSWQHRRASCTISHVSDKQICAFRQTWSKARLTNLTGFDFDSCDPVLHSRTHGHRPRPERDRGHAHHHKQRPASEPPQGTRFAVVIRLQHVSSAL